MEIVSWKNIPIFTEITLLLIGQNTIAYGIVFGHKSDKGWQLGCSTATNICYGYVSFATTFYTRWQVQ